MEKRNTDELNYDRTERDRSNRNRERREHSRSCSPRTEGRSRDKSWRRSPSRSGCVSRSRSGGSGRVNSNRNNRSSPSPPPESKGKVSSTEVDENRTLTSYSELETAPADIPQFDPELYKDYGYGEESETYRFPRGRRRDRYYKDGYQDDSYKSRNKDYQQDNQYDGAATYQRYLYNAESNLWYDQETGTYSYYDEASGVYVPYTVPNPYQDATIRLIVLSSNVLEPGNVAIVDSDGLNFGRDRPSTSSTEKKVRLPELDTSKLHATVYLQPIPADPSLQFINPTELDDAKYKFCIIDCGSQHGTTVNSKRLSESKITSLPYLLSHEDVIVIGSTSFQVHNHKSGLVCDTCKSDLTNLIDTSNQPKVEIKEPVLVGKSRQKTLERERMLELNRLRKSYDLPQENINLKKFDRPHPRRNYQNKNTLPVSNQTINVEPAAVPVPAPASSNLVQQMLMKQGWSQGQGLGKNNQGIVEPIQASSTENRAGIGAGYSNLGEVGKQETLKEKTWKVYRERFKNMKD